MCKKIMYESTKNQSWENRGQFGLLVTIGFTLKVPCLVRRTLEDPEGRGIQLDR